MSWSYQACTEKQERSFVRLEAVGECAEQFTPSDALEAWLLQTLPRCQQLRPTTCFPSLGMPQPCLHFQTSFLFSLPSTPQNQLPPPLRSHCSPLTSQPLFLPTLLCGERPLLSPAAGPSISWPSPESLQSTVCRISLSQILDFVS